VKARIDSHVSLDIDAPIVREGGEDRFESYIASVTGSQAHRQRLHRVGGILIVRSSIVEAAHLESGADGMPSSVVAKVVEDLVNCLIGPKHFLIGGGDEAAEVPISE